MNRDLGIFIFHNDLRVKDNIGLAQLARNCDTVLPVFIFTPEQLGASNKYRSMIAIEFMVAQLAVLDAELRDKGGRLYMFYGNTTRVITQLIKALKPVLVCNNANYTPFALERDAGVRSACERNHCEYLLCEDYGLYPIGATTPGASHDNNSRSSYKKFTPYFNAASKKHPARPITYQLTNLYHGTIRGELIMSKVKSKLKLKGITIMTARSLLASLHKFNHYNRDRNMLSKATTHASAYIKFGVVSVRDVYWTFKDELGKASSDLIKQLYWREFYMNLVWAYPYVLQQQNFNTNYHARWISAVTPGNKKYLQAWCNGTTGYPIVDACMTELNRTGYMHNRGRLIVAGFLTKLLGWHWKFGELYFATRLMDYDPAQNNGNWQFVAGSGVDQQPYFRMFNPWIQSAKHDPDGSYIRTWCQCYTGFPPQVLHDQKKLIKYITENKTTAPTPIVDYETARDETRERYK